MLDDTAINKMFVRYIDVGLSRKAYRMSRDSVQYSLETTDLESVPEAAVLGLMEEAIPVENLSIEQITNLEDYFSDERISQAVERLSAREKAVLYLYYVQGYPDRLVGQILQVSLQFISQVRREVRKKFLTEEG